MSQSIKEILVIFWFFVILSISSALATQETVGIAEVVWIERVDQNNHIKFAKYDGEQWLHSSFLYSSPLPISGPTISRKPNGERLLIWVEQVKNRTVLKAMTGHWIQQDTNNSKLKVSIQKFNWSSAFILSDFRLENFAPSIVVDARQRFWVVWSSSSSTQSDIFMIREFENKWTTPIQVNSNNLTPDMRPLVNADTEGNIYVTWTAYNRVLNGFSKTSALYSLDGSKKETDSIDYAKSLEAHNSIEHNFSNIEDPGFLPPNSRIIVHFPQNTIIQSISR